jgi:putative hemolysin
MTPRGTPLDVHRIWPGLPFWLYPVLDRLLGAERANQLLRPIQHLQGLAWLSPLLEAGGVTVQASWERCEELPRAGSVLFVANHPTGALDALVGLRLLLPLRPDVKLIANVAYSQHFPCLAGVTLGIAPPHKRPRRVVGLRALLAHLDGGGAVLVFPAGGVSTYREGGRLEDLPWSPGVGKLVHKYRMPVVPIYLEGRNRWWYHAARRIHRNAAALLLLRELLAKRHAHVRVGGAIRYDELRAQRDPAALAAWLRQRTYALASRPEPSPAPVRPSAARALTPTGQR